MQIGSSQSFLSSISQVLAPQQAPKQLKTEESGSDSKKDLYAANDDAKSSQAPAHATNTRRGSTVNLLV
jgi:hypothetical protein